MNRQKWSSGLLIVGAVVFAAGLAWPFVLPKEMLWDDARAKDLTDASESLHDMMHAHGRGHDHEQFGSIKPDDAPQVVNAARRYRLAQSELNFAQFWTESAPSYLRWTGLAISLVGVAAYFASRGGN